ncbi:MAG: M28 family peptidase [Gemmatimonadaceae bacterium]|nr:M28 family peptidase [Gemmatimonadaceae bacterium]
MGDPLARARTHLTAIARAPRAAGGDADAAARRYAARVLEELGYRISEQHFGYSELPGRFATPIFGGAGLLALAGILVLTRAGHPGDALMLLLAAAAALGGGGAWLARRGVLDLPLMRARGTNLFATRGDAQLPRVWLVAHTDSKSQPVPQAARAAGIVLLAGSIVVAGLVTVVQLAGWWVAGGGAAWAVAVAGTIGAIPVIASIVGNRSDGALDNASGVAAVLLAADLVAGDPGVGVAITAAEELGLAGARAWAATEESGQIALNCDGVDDVGVLTVMYSGSAPAEVLQSLQEAARDGGHRCRVMRLVPGLLVDAVALSDAGWQAATVSRGTLRTLARVHTSRDSLAHLTGAGIPEAAAVLARAAQLLSTRGAP